MVRQGHFEAAVSDYSKAIAMNPHHCRAFYNRAFSHERLRRWDAAIADYDRALQLEPTNATAYHNRCPCNHLVLCPHGNTSARIHVCG